MIISCFVKYSNSDFQYKHGKIPINMVDLEREQRYQDELEIAIQTAKEAGVAILREINNRTFTQDGSELKSPVDIIAGDIIYGRLHGNFPGDKILIEDRSGQETETPEGKSSRIWVVDPLDGTTNFINGSHDYSVLIGLVENGELVLGVSLLPATDELLYAVKDGGAYCNGKKIHVSEAEDMSKSTVALDSGYDPEGVTQVANLFQKLKPQVGNIAMLNSNGYALSMLSMGRGLAGYIHFSSKAWEAAGLLIAREAGGLITDLNGNNLSLDFSSRSGFPFVASNRKIHPQLIKNTTHK